MWMPRCGADVQLRVRTRPPAAVLVHRYQREMERSSITGVDANIFVSIECHQHQSLRALSV